jgi:hypothetical protein
MAPDWKTAEERGGKEGEKRGRAEVEQGYV